MLIEITVLQILPRFNYKNGRHEVIMLAYIQTPDTKGWIEYDAVVTKEVQGVEHTFINKFDLQYMLID